MRWAVLVALLVVGFGTYSLVRSAHDMGMAVLAETGEQTGRGAAPRLVDRELRVRSGMAMLDLACASTAGCHGVMTIELKSGKTGTAPYAVMGGQTTRYALPLPPGARSKRAKLSWREDSGAAASAEVRLKRS
ncbi:hypothetical protein OJ997_33385 [Solirubrobacter phytolaccae]|uniref:Uncharacterized protein n=1 Tax=Solirubrobacter phytolaccae TaxID=1404360 RepID=A0A9X3NKH1_9ACTN|nr:hypothetical protein [Solirubrobacter phytolaccae]MDA0185246.1 hypothetical protein [Solirubrobacter phytolaccae]